MIGNSDGSIVLKTEIDKDGLTQSLKSVLSSVGKALATIFSVRQIAGFVSEAKSLYQEQVQAEARLESIMRTRIKATDEEIQSVKELTALEQQRGIVGDETQMAGAQELATYVESKEALEQLIPVMNDMVAQQYGFNATQESAANIATMLGKVLDGQTGALSRYGYFFSDAEADILKTGDEMQRVAVLSSIVEESIGGVNYALAQTDVGRQIQFANAWGDIKEQIGAAAVQISAVFMPVLSRLAAILQAVANFATKVANAIASVFGKQVVQSAEEQTAAIGGTVENQQELTDAVNDTAKATKGALAGFDELNTVTKQTAVSAGAGSSGTVSTASVKKSLEDIKGIDEVTKKITPFERGLEKLKTAFEKLKEISLDNVKNSLDRLGESLSPYKDLVLEGLEWLWNEILVPMAEWTIEELIPNFLDLVSAALDSLKVIIDASKESLKWWWDNMMKPLAEWTADAVIGFIKNLTDRLTEFTNWARENPEKIQVIADIILSFLAGLMTYFTVKNVIGWINKLTQAFVKLGGVNGVLALLKGTINSTAIVIGALTAAAVFWVKNWDDIKKSFNNMSSMQKAATVILAVAAAIAVLWVAITMGAAAAGIVAGLAAIGLGAFILSQSSSVTSSASGRGVDGSFGGGSYSSIPSGGSVIKSNVKPLKIGNYNVPALAKGAVIPPNKPFYAMLGDQRNGTNIEAPLDTIKQAVAEVIGNRQDNRPIILQVDGREIARAARSGENQLGTQTVYGEFANAY